jgi:acetyltransferase-like isoleucine patch superfamily enzyme
VTRGILGALNRLGLMWRLVLTQTCYRAVFGRIGPRTIVYPFLLLLNPHRVSLGARSLIRRGCRLEVVDHGQPWEPAITIGDGVNIEQNVHLVCHDRITIGNHVSIAGNCAIVDVSHIAAALLAPRQSDIDPRRSHVTIGDHSFLGYGTTILPNVTIGAYCVIGAGSVVSHDIPDYCVAAGVPARVLRRLQPHASQGSN